MVGTANKKKEEKSKNFIEINLKIGNCFEQKDFVSKVLQKKKVIKISM